MIHADAETIPQPQVRGNDGSMAGRKSQAECSRWTKRVKELADS